MPANDAATSTAHLAPPATTTVRTTDPLSPPWLAAKARQKPISVFASVNGYAQAEIVVGASRP
jgi:hypothetical protein